jgi:hypothetical protein
LRGNSAKSQNTTEQPAFIDVQAKRTGRHRATIAREISEAEKIGDALMKKIVDIRSTSRARSPAGCDGRTRSPKDRRSRH